MRSHLPTTDSTRTPTSADREVRLSDGIVTSLEVTA